MSVVVAEKNHEQYLEQIEIAVAETTKELMSKHNGDLRAMAKLVAEKQVEINRLKEFQDNDRKTIRSLRLKLKEAVDEIEANEHDVKTLENTREAVRKALGVEPDPTAETLVEEIECRCSTWDTKEKEYEAEIEELKEEIKELKKGDKRKLKKKVEELEERLDEAWSEYNTEQEMRDKAEQELEELQNENEELKKENKGLRNGGGDYISRKEHQKVCDILNDEAEDYKEKFMTITGKLKKV